MTLRVVLPVKPLATGKSRLAGRLDHAARLRLNRDLLVRTLRVLVRFAGGPAVLVVSRDADVLAVAAVAGALALMEEEPGGLNAALMQAVATLPPSAVVFVVPVDLPHLGEDDLAAVVAAGAKRHPAVALAPDRSGQGTNALLAAPADVVPFRFGPDSFAAHLDAARRRGIEPRIVRRPGLAFDLDSADDYERLLARPHAEVIPHPSQGAARA